MRGGYRRRLGLVLGVGAVLAFCLAGTGVAQDIEREPIRYSDAKPSNVVSALQERISAGAVKLEFEPEHGYLRSLLKELNVPESSQVLVFSKTSLQRDRISPKTPRAVYFNDDVLIGFCLRGQVVEISAVDDTLGTVFYTQDQIRSSEPAPDRQTESCLLCHSSSSNQGVPGHLVRSLFVDRQGQPLLASGTYRTDHTSPLTERWGGWYVTGTSGEQKHLGNLISSSSSGRLSPDTVDNEDGVNRKDLSDLFTTSMYLSPHSDIVALMVLEHQTAMLNRIARAGLETRMAMHYETEMNKALGEPADHHFDSARSRIKSVGEAVVGYLLFEDEIALTDEIVGTSTFAADFSARGLRDPKGRSLRDFDLKTRLFKYPLSYVIQTRAFEKLPNEVKDHVYHRLWDILHDQGTKDDPKLNADDRAAILEILDATQSGLPEFWRAGRAKEKEAPAKP